MSEIQVNNFMDDVKEAAPAQPVDKELNEKVATNDAGHLAKIKVGDKEYKVVNTVTMYEILVHKLENGKEISQVVAHEFMMVEHKPYMVKLLTDAIMTVMRATKREPMIKLVSRALYNKLRGKPSARNLRTGR